MGTHRIAVCNKKGGTGKTTTAINLSVALAQLGQRVLLVDLGPQRNASATLAPDVVQTSTHLRDVLVQGTPLEQAVLPTGIEGLDVLPASLDMETLKAHLAAQPGGIQRLAHALRKGPQQRWDFVLFDCPPTIEHLTVSGVVASTDVLIVLEPGAYAIDGLSEIWSDIEELSEVMEFEVRLLGVLFNKSDPRTRLSREVLKWMEEAFPDAAFRTQVPFTVAVAEAPFHNKPVLLYQPQSPGSVAFRALAKEVLERTQGRNDV